MLYQLSYLGTEHGNGGDTAAARVRLRCIAITAGGVQPRNAVSGDRSLTRWHCLI